MTINFYQTLTAHIWPNSGRTNVIYPPKDRKFYEKHGSRRQFDVDTLTRDVKINRRATFIRVMRLFISQDVSRDKCIL